MITLLLFIFGGAYVLGKVLYPMPTKHEPPRFNLRWWDRGHIEVPAAYIPVNENEPVREVQVP